MVPDMQTQSKGSVVPGEGIEPSRACAHPALMVPPVGIEPTRDCSHRILSPACIPVPPRRHHQGGTRILPQIGIPLCGTVPPSRHLMSRLRLGQKIVQDGGRGSLSLLVVCFASNPSRHWTSSAERVADFLMDVYGAWEARILPLSLRFRYTTKVFCYGAHRVGVEPEGRSGENDYGCESCCILSRGGEICITRGYGSAGECHLGSRGGSSLARGGNL